MPLLVKDGYADLFCFTEVSRADVSTRNDPVGGRANWYELPSIEFTGVSWVRLPEIRAKRETFVSLGSLLVLSERPRPSDSCCVVLSVPGVVAPPGTGPATPAVGSSVWMKQHRFPYGHVPETQNVYEGTSGQEPMR